MPKQPRTRPLSKADAEPASHAQGQDGAGKGRISLSRGAFAFLLACAFLAGLLAGSLVFQAMDQGQAQAPQAAAPAARDSLQTQQAQIEASRSAGSAIAMLESQAASRPSDKDALIALANAYFDADRPSEAVPVYERALALDPANADVWTDLGIMYRALGRYGDALKAFDKALAAVPDHANAQFNAGVVRYFDLKDKEGGRRVWEALLKQRPGARAPDGRSLADFLKSLP
ncbi:MAG: tetratricopeptide repeat protein [Desulfovibrio sp.]|nr:tetratricopeptide repeat protein [Desulfovibrio sp.]